MGDVRSVSDLIRLVESVPHDPTFLVFLEFCRDVQSKGIRTVSPDVRIRQNGFPFDMYPGAWLLSRSNQLTLVDYALAENIEGVALARMDMKEAVQKWSVVEAQATTPQRGAQAGLRRFIYEERLALYSTATSSEVPAADMDIAVFRACHRRVQRSNDVAALLAHLEVTDGGQRIVDWYAGLTARHASRDWSVLPDLLRACFAPDPPTVASGAVLSEVPFVPVGPLNAPLVAEGSVPQSGAPSDPNPLGQVNQSLDDLQSSSPEVNTPPLATVSGLVAVSAPTPGQSGSGLIDTPSGEGVALGCHIKQRGVANAPAVPRVQVGLTPPVGAEGFSGSPKAAMEKVSEAAALESGAVAPGSERSECVEEEVAGLSAPLPPRVGEEPVVDAAAMWVPNAILQESEACVPFTPALKLTQGIMRPTPQAHTGFPRRRAAQPPAVVSLANGIGAIGARLGPLYVASDDECPSPVAVQTIDTVKVILGRHNSRLVHILLGCDSFRVLWPFELTDSGFVDFCVARAVHLAPGTYSFLHVPANILGRLCTASVPRHERFDHITHAIKWCRARDVLEFDFLLCPVGDDSHWALAVIQFPGEGP